MTFSGRSWPRSTSILTGVSARCGLLPKQKQVHVYEKPERVHIVKVTDELDGGALLPGFRIPVAALFEKQPAGAAAAEKA